ncbi:hypothetical protein ATE47_04140 [Chryseobacterium sp. IHB B 17019]|uniref:DNA-packaging protein n=1 Tax=Chryseobacterium sp. IHB B 17019 TaxID=1721091 RepID=UPI0007205DC9|nr:DNA-packaging protein [Chryseobacterium sp. IHB B 17019]ALR29759.1 hypothetical protein ATE47_04140 [Chryseobacterium sp. IHB B 17019]
MAAPKGNQFWKLRSKHGRDKLFESSQLLWEASTEYFEWCDENPLIEIDYKGKDADRVEIPKMRPYTITGLCLYLDCNVQYLKTFKAQLNKNDENYEDFNTVITRIEETIYTQKFTGAASGFLNPNIIARDLGLTDSKDVTSKGEKIESGPSKITVDIIAPTDE